MQLSELYARCKTRFRDESCEIYTNANWTAYLNDAYRDIQALTDQWPFLQASSSSVSVASGGRAADLPTRAYRVTAVYNTTNQVQMFPLDGPAAPYRTWEGQDETGTPIHYRVRGACLEVYPKPTATTAIKVEYVASLTALGSDADIPSMPDRYHGMLVEGALARAYLDDGNADQAERHQAAFEDQLQGMLTDLLSGQSDRYPQIVDTFFA